MPKIVICDDIDGGQHEVPVNQLQWRPSAYGIVIKDGALLTPKHFGKHNLPGGGIELGELPEDAVIREVKEETGIDVTNPRLVTAHSTFFKQPFHKDSSYVQSILLYYLCDFVGGEFSADGFDEHEKLYAAMPEWCPLETLSDIQVASTHDWRVIVRQAAKEATL